MRQTSDLRDETASRLFVMWMQIITELSTNSQLPGEKITEIVIKAAPQCARDAIELADIFIKELTDDGNYNVLK